MDKKLGHRLQTAGRGEVLLKSYSVFPGICLTFHDVRADSFSPRREASPGLLEITHCREGRLEYPDQSRAFFLGEGDFSIRQTRREDGELLCPVRQYRGLSLLIRPEQAPPCTACFLGEADVSLAGLSRKFCGEGRHFIMGATPRLGQVFAQLYQAPPGIRKGYFKVKVLELLLLLSCLEPAMSQGEQRACTPFQVRMAREAIAFVDAHRDQRITAAQLGRELGVSPEQLRHSVQQVYGKPLYQCVRAYKMRLAARLLVETDRTVLDIAGELGYGNSSKFAAAFREVLGVPPAEYRQQAWSGRAPLHFGAKKPEIGADRDDPHPV